ncbi:MAG: BrnA antitoxin family protein [Armatimonadota bacterium]|nr:BrnA antitoxin family protein [Armatimonadota bacterium]
MSENKLPEFGSIEEVVEFFETHDMGEYDLPEVHFGVEIMKRTFLVSVDKELMKKLSQVAQAQHTSTEELVNAWLEEKVAQAV